MKKPNSGRQPDYRVAALDKSTDAKAEVGAAWINDDGSIAVVLHAFVKLEQHGRRQLLVTLFPNKKGAGE